MDSVKPLCGCKALVTSGPTHEPIDPVRYMGNYSSGRQGHAIAAALLQAGAEVTLVTGPVTLPDPEGVNSIHITTARQMLAACEAALPVDIAVCAAAVADWRPKETALHKIKKNGAGAPMIELVENPDILYTLSHHLKRPRLVVGFAAETKNILQNARAKRIKKGCDWILANDVSEGKGFGLQENALTLITAAEEETWGTCSKRMVAQLLIERIISSL